MKVYLAALLYNNFCEGSPPFNRLDETEKDVVRRVQYVLDSYHYIGNKRMVDRIRGTGRRIFLDSGAFSSFTQGVTVDLNRYCRYIRENEDLFEIVSVLDAIGDHRQTYANQRAMEGQGVYPLPCFHYGEPLEVLEFYAHHYPYITIGGMVPISTPQLKVWLDQIWHKVLTHSDGTPKLKVHGFGLTSVPLMARYPWYSVDSSSWVQLGGMGNIFIPEFGTLAISEHAPQRKEAGKHFDNLPKPHQDVVAEYIESRGFDIDRLHTEHLSRKVFNAMTYGSMSSEETEPFRVSQPVLF